MSSQHSPRTHSFHLSSSTHAGGIQPSSQFFYPSRPIYSRPSSPASSLQDPNSDGDLSAPLDSAPEDLPQFLKPSREPLLPIGTRSSTTQRPSISTNPRDRNPSILPTPLSPRKSQSTAVRNSFDRVLGLSRGLSLDSIRKSIHSTQDIPTTGRSTAFDSSRILDEERGEGTGDIYPLSPYKPSHSHSDFLHSPSFVHHHSPTPSSASPSPVPSFIPTPPPDAPPLAQTPLRKATSKIGNPGRFVRRYELHLSRNHFLCSGRLLTGGDSPWAFVGTFTLVLGLAGVWFATTCVYWWRREGAGGKVIVVVGAYLAALVISSMLTTVWICFFFLFLLSSDLVAGNARPWHLAAQPRPGTTVPCYIPVRRRATCSNAQRSESPVGCVSASATYLFLTSSLHSEFASSIARRVGCIAHHGRAIARW